MKNSLFRTILKIWIAIASVVAFAGGWVVLGHAIKEDSTGSTGGSVSPAAPRSTPLPTLAPLPSINNLGNSPQNLQPLPAPSSSQALRPRLRSRGS